MVREVGHPLCLLTHWPYWASGTRETRHKREKFLLWTATLWLRLNDARRNGKVYTMPVALSKLNSKAPGAREVFEHFFHVSQKGYSFSGDAYQLSTVAPRILNVIDTELIRQGVLHWKWSPPPKPSGGVISKVLIQHHNQFQVLNLLEEKGREDLVMQAVWLFSQHTCDFVYVPAGKLQQRDKCVWPIAGIETWPSEIRTLMFGQGIDIDSAFSQFLISEARTAFDSPTTINMLFPDIIRCVEDKTSWREELCHDVLQQNATPEAISTIKNIVMSCANGSRVSPQIMLCEGGQSMVRDLVIQHIENPCANNLIKAGTRLQTITRQYTNIKRLVAKSHGKHGRQASKEVFTDYFSWERGMRYAIWEECDRTGIMMHDGIDGVPPSALADLDGVSRRVGARLSL
jgi:hypothetical protein